MSRATMAALITEVRGITNAGVDEWTNGTVTYWDDDAVQNLLDQRRLDFEFVPMVSTPTPAGGGSQHWLNYDLPHRNIEAASGTTIFTVYDAVGSAVGTAQYSVDYVRGRVTFATDTGGLSYYASGRTYDLYGASADLLERWAAHEALQFDFSADGQSFRRSQKRDALLQLAVDCRGKAWPQRVRAMRADLNANRGW